MASFDFIEAAVRGYEFVWRERKYLARVAFPVVFVKVACVLAVFVFGAQKLYLLEGLIMFPGYILEALIVIGAMRYMLYGENIFVWGRVFAPFKPIKPMFAPVSSENRAFCLQAGVAMYLLIKLFELLLDSYSKGLNDTIRDETIAQTPPDPTFLGALIIMALLGGFIWLIRLLFLYVPLTMNVRLGDYMKVVKGFETSFYILGAYMVCFLPTLLGFSVLADVAMLPFSGNPSLLIIIEAVFIGVYEVVSALIIAVAMTYGFTELLFGSDKKEEK